MRGTRAVVNDRIDALEQVRTKTSGTGYSPECWRGSGQTRSRPTIEEAWYWLLDRVGATAEQARSSPRAGRHLELPSPRDRIPRPIPEISSAAVCRRHRPAARHRDLGGRGRIGPGCPCLPVCWAARNREDIDGKNSRQDAELHRPGFGRCPVQPMCVVRRNHGGFLHGCHRTRRGLAQQGR